MASELISLVQLQVKDVLKSVFKSQEVDFSPDKLFFKVSRSSKCGGEVTVFCRSAMQQLSCRLMCSTNKPSTQLIGEVQRLIDDYISLGSRRFPSLFIKKAAVSDKGVINFELNRPVLFKHLLQDVLTSKSSYGWKGSPGPASQNFIVYSVQISEETGMCGQPRDKNVPRKLCIRPNIHINRINKDHLCDADQSNLSLEDGRTLLVSKLLGSLVGKGKGRIDSYGTVQKPLIRKSSQKFHQIADSLGQSLQSPVSLETLVSPQPPPPSPSSQQSPCTLSMVKMTSDIKLPESEEFLSKLQSIEVGRDGSLTVNGKMFLQDRGKLGCSKNIEVIEVVKSDGSLTQAGQLALDIYKALKNAIEGGTIIIVASQRHSFTSQQAIVLVQMALSPSVLSRFVIKLLEVASVSCVSPKPVLTVEEYVCLRLAEMRLACEIKYGSTDTNPALEKIASCMTDAVVKFDLLGTDPKNTLKLKVSDASADCSLGNRSEGSFVLYNYARLATLQLNYEEAVKQGSYPSLPSDLGDINYSLLNDEDEWELLYSFVFLFPTVLEEASAIFGAMEESLVVQSGVKKLCQFLSKMCHTFSRYYSRVKVLLAPEACLIPLIQARMTLILAIKQVLLGGLQILGIEPLNQL